MGHGRSLQGSAQLCRFVFFFCRCSSAPLLTLLLGRMYFILLATLSSAHSPLLKELTVAACFKWAKMLSAGKKVNLINVPAEVNARRADPSFSDEDINPSSRSKKAKGEMKAMLESPAMPTIGTPSPSANKLSTWHAGAAERVVLPARAAGDADLSRWITSEVKVCNFLLPAISAHSQTPQGALRTTHNDLQRSR